jgi:Calcineurin-like phosphoesterase
LRRRRPDDYIRAVARPIPPPTVIQLVAILALAAVAGGSAAPVVSAKEPATSRKAPRYRYIFHTGPDQRGAASLGFNLLDVDAKAEADALPRGTRGLYWLGDYLNAPTCAWEKSDDAIDGKVRAAKGDPKVWGYYFSNEPDPYGCPNAVAAHRARAALIKSIDPTKKTYISLDMNWRAQALKQIPLWVGVTDYVGLNPYTCFVGRPTCDFAWLRRVIATANKARLSYFGHVQAFQAEEWRWPTPAELRRMLNLWAASKQKGYAVFTWSWGGSALLSQPKLVRVLKQFNNPAGRTTAAVGAATEIHYTFAGATSVVFDWAGTAKTLRFGRTSRYTRKVVGHPVTPAPRSSAGPFWEARITGLRRGASYHYRIGGGPDSTFTTAPTKPFRFDVEGDVGDSASASRVGPTQAQIAGDKPAFVIVAGDLTYGNVNGQRAVDRHFDDVMVWSRRAAYMPAWGNHEWDSSGDDLRNYKGRFAIPHGAPSPGAPATGCCGEDWGWFDAAGVRFISYPEPYTRATWTDWQSKADRLMAAAQRDRRIHFIVTYGHRPAYSTGYHSGESTLASILDAFGDRYPKYVLNLNAHSHDYERFRPIHGVVHVTAAGGGAPLEAPWRRTDPRTAYRAMHLEHLRVGVTADRIRLQAVCGPASSDDDMSCRPDEVIDSYVITRRS